MPPPPEQRWQDDSTTLLLLGLVGLLTCQILAPVAWYLAARHREERLQDGELPDAYARGARVLGMIGTGLLVLGTGVWCLFAMVAATYW